MLDFFRLAERALSEFIAIEAECFSIYARPVPLTPRSNRSRVR